jgi:hypothetical protein
MSSRRDDQTHGDEDNGRTLNALRDLLLILALDMSALDRFVHDPDDVMAAAGISEGDQRLLLSGDAAAINERLWGRDVPRRGPLLAVEVVTTSDGPRPLIRGTGTPVLAAALQELTRVAAAAPFTANAPGQPVAADTPPAAPIGPNVPSPTPGTMPLSPVAATTWPAAGPAAALPTWTSQPWPSAGRISPYGPRRDSSFADQHQLPPGAVDERDLDLLVAAVNMQPALTGAVLLAKSVERAAPYPIESPEALVELFDTLSDGRTVTFGTRTVDRRQFESYLEYFHFPIEDRTQLMSPLVAILEIERHRELRHATGEGRAEN